MRNGSLCLKLPNIQVCCGTSKIYPRHFIFRQYITTTSVQVLHTLPIKSKMMKKISLLSAHLNQHPLSNMISGTGLLVIGCWSLHIELYLLMSNVDNCGRGRGLMDFVDICKLVFLILLFQYVLQTSSMGDACV